MCSARLELARRKGSRRVTDKDNSRELRSDVLKGEASTLNVALDLAKNNERLWERIRGNGVRS